MPSSTQYDYIICGAGCAGLSLLMHFIKSGKFENKSILLIDKSLKNVNDRTWCFWEDEPCLFESIVYKKWEQLWFHSDTFSEQLSIKPYQYKLIKGLHFYNYCLEEIKKHPNIIFQQATVERVFSNESITGLVAEGKTYTCRYLFNSIIFQKPYLKPHQYYLLQHFKGWFIQTAQPRFDEKIATIMDFRTDQSHGTTFFYVLPFSPAEALVEYTLFSNSVLNDNAYEAALKNYVEDHLRVGAYTVAEKEFGIIPMTNFSFPFRNNNIINIGTAGGQTKASSGYTFKFIQKQSLAIVNSLLSTGAPFSFQQQPPRFHFYDSVLLHILNYSKLPGYEVFTDLFRKNKPQQVFKFLDNQTTLQEELSIISSLPILPFSKAALHQIRMSLTGAGSTAG